jgi:hypothetical protein
VLVGGLSLPEPFRSRPVLLLSKAEKLAMRTIVLSALTLTGVLFLSEPAGAQPGNCSDEYARSAWEQKRQQFEGQRFSSRTLQVTPAWSLLHAEIDNGMRINLAIKVNEIDLRKIMEVSILIAQEIGRAKEPLSISIKAVGAWYDRFLGSDEPLTEVYYSVSRSKNRRLDGKPDWSIVMRSRAPTKEELEVSRTFRKYAPKEWYTECIIEDSEFLRGLHNTMLQRTSEELGKSPENVQDILNSMVRIPRINVTPSHYPGCLRKDPGVQCVDLSLIKKAGNFP